LMFLLGETKIYDSTIEFRNDSMVIKVDDSETYLIPTEKGVLLSARDTEFEIQLLRSDQKDFSSSTKEVLGNIATEKGELAKFKNELGKWQKGNVVDEFGDKTDKSYPYLIVSADHENSSVVQSSVYVKTVIEGESLYFEIFNNSLTLKESFPDSEYGKAKIKWRCKD